MLKYGKVAGGLGLIALVVCPLAWKLIGTPYAIGEGALGILLVVFYLGTHKGSQAISAKQQANQRASFFWVSSAIMAGATLALLVGVNFITARRGKTVDMTNKKIFSLSPQTQSTMKDLKEPIKAIGFMDSKHPAYDALKALFEKYANESDKFSYDFIDPKKSIEMNAKYQIKEGQTTVILTKGTGATEQHTALSVVSEQDLTNALIKLNSSGTQKVYFVTGHAEWTVSDTQENVNMGGASPSVSELKSNLAQEGYAVESLDLATQQNRVPPDAAVLVIAHASTPYSEGELAAIEQYLGQGGRLMYFADFDAKSGLEPLLARYGIEIADGVVADGLNEKNPYRAVGFPTDHEVSAVLKKLGANMLIDSSRALIPLREGTLPGVVTTPVLLSSPMSWVETTPEAGPPVTSDGERTGALPLIVAATLDTKNAPGKRFEEARVLVFGDAGLILNANWGGNEVTRNLVLNGFAWVSTQFTKITIRPPDRDISTITITDAMMEQITFLSIIVLPQLMISLGVAIWVSRRNR